LPTYFVLISIGSKDRTSARGPLGAASGRSDVPFASRW
jgi:hypothetical protein